MIKLKRYLHHLFIPHEGNNFRAKALHIDFLTYYLIFALFLTFALKIISGNSGDVLGFATDITVDKLFQMTNNVRSENNLTALTYNEQLASAAQQKASDMFAKNYWSHYAPDGGSPWDFILNSGYRYEYAGENLAKNFLFSQGVVDAWMNSSSHRENILRKDYMEVGFGVMNGILNGEETTLVVQMFGKPLDSPVTFETSDKPMIPAKTVQAESNSVVKNKAQTETAILSQKSPSIKNKIGLWTFNSNLVFITFLLLALFLDLYFASKLRIIRITGKNLAHLIFIGFIFAGIILLTKGSIL